MNNDNRRETGGRVPKVAEDQEPRPTTETGDRGDRPKKPYGLIRPAGESNEKTRQSDNTDLDDAGR